MRRKLREIRMLESRSWWMERRKKKMQCRESERYGTGGVTGRRKEASALLPNCPSLLSLSLFFWSQLVQINTVSLTRVSNSKLKSIIRPCIDYSFPNISRFDSINDETNSMVNNLIVLGFLVDLVTDKNSYQCLLKSSKNLKTNNNNNILMATITFLLIKVPLQQAHRC